MESSYFNHKARSKKVGTIIGWVLLGSIAFVGLAFLFGYVVMLLWNWLMPVIFGLTAIGYWQAVGIIILAKVLFGGFGGHKRHKSDKHRSSRRSKVKSCKNGFSKWKYYDKFWKEKGEDAFKEYIEVQDIETNSAENKDSDTEENEKTD